MRKYETKKNSRTHKKMTLDGNIVISVGLFGHFGDSEVWKAWMKEH